MTLKSHSGVFALKVFLIRKQITKCDKSMARSDVGITQCNNGTVKCEKKNRIPLNVTKVHTYVMLVPFNVTMEPSNVRKKIREPLDVTKK